MADFDYPGVCLTKIDKDRTIFPPDLDPTRERVNKLPEGYTKTIISGLRMAFPDKFDSDEEAYMAFDVMKAIIFNGLRNNDLVDVEGMGEFRLEPKDGKRHVVFTPEPALEVAVNE